MRGLPFPTNAVFDPEQASEHGTPASAVSDIPIDPALAAPPPADPAVPPDGNLHSLRPHQQPHPVVLQHEFSPPQKRYYSQEPLKYDQGPQGDPFAPHPPAAYLPIPDTGPPRPPKPQRRRRKPRREKECGFCQGSDTKNKHSESEAMVSCEECGRSGHPSCMQLAKVASVVRSYPWRCIECKICEICQEKGDDARILFCDFCDRGWHMDCLHPPLAEEPPGHWYCPRCPPLNMLPPDSDSIRAQHGSFNPEAMHHPTGKPDADRQTGDPSGTVHETGIQVDDSSTDESSDSDSDSDETVGTPVTRHPQSVKKRPAKRTAGAQTPHPPKRMRIKVRTPAPPLIVRLRLPPKGKGKEREDDTDPSIFEDLLSPAERDMSKTTIDNFDRTRFEKSRLAAEGKLYPAPALVPSTTENPDTPIAGPSSRPLRSTSLHQLSIPHTLPPPSPAPSTPSFVPPTPGTFSQTPNTPTVPDGQSTLRIRTIRFGSYDIHPWYDAPFPEEYANIPDGRLWICEFCLKYMRSRFAFGRHRLKCKARHPPGDEIYRDGSISIFEVDGRKNKIYCQNLCLLSKMFLDHKSLFYDVEPFLFYVMTEIDDIGAHFVGYFSKEKCSPKQYNVSCIMTLPVRQRQGWGNFLIDFSYLLSKKEQRPGSPEKPLSGLGALGYKNYWTLALMRYLVSAPLKPTLEDISRATSMTVEDVFTTLTQQDMVTVDTTSPNPARPSPGQSIKFPRGRKNGIARKHLQRPNTQKHMEGGGNKSNVPFIAPIHYEISWDQDKVERWLETWEKKGYLRVKPEKLKWTPFVLSRTKAGVEFLQAKMGPGFGALAHLGTPPSPMDGGTPMLDIGNRAKSLGSGQGLSHEQNARAVIAHDAGEVTAAHLFDDDVLHEKTAISLPKRQLGNEHRDSNLDSLAMPTQTGSVRAILDGDSGIQEANSDSLPDGTSNAMQGIENATPTVPNKRRRGHPSGAQQPGMTSVVPRASSTESRLTSPSKPTPSRKRKKHDFPTLEGLAVSTDLGYSEWDSDCVNEAVDRRPTPNGEGHTSNGIPRNSTQRSLDASPTVETREGEKELEKRDALPGDFAPRECSDVKSEDLETPLTCLTSRHSVPSDDTVCVAEGVDGSAVRSKISEEGEGILPLSGPRDAGNGGSAEDALQVVEDSDLDAEGEPDDEI